MEKRIKDEEGSNKKTKQKLYFTKIDSKSVPRNSEYYYIDSLNSTFQEQMGGKKEKGHLHCSLFHVISLL